MKVRRDLLVALLIANATIVLLLFIPTRAAIPPTPMQAATANPLVGHAAPDFKLDGLDGASHTLADIKGSVTVLDFWGVWCVPCHLALPHVDELYKAQASHGLKVFAIDNGDDKAKVKQFITDNKLSLPVLLDTDSKAADAYKVDEYPQTVVIGKDGRIRAIIVGFKPETTPAELEKAVAAAMSESP